MFVGKVVIDANHAVVLTGVAFVRGDQFAGSIPIVRSVRRRQQIEKRLYQRIHRNSDTATRIGGAAGGRIRTRWQQTLMREGIGYRGNCRGCLYLAKPFIVDEEERVIMLQWPSDSGTELIADERRDRARCQIEVVLRVERCIPMQFPQRSVKLVIARLGCQVDDSAAMPAVLRVESLGQDADLLQLIQAKKKTRSARRRITEDRIGGIHAVDQNVRHTRTNAVNCNLPGLAARKQRRSTAGVWSDSGLERNRTDRKSVV